MPINWHRTSELWLSLEDYYNAGYTPEQVREVIERQRDCDDSPLRCESMFINGNWIVKTCSNNPYFHDRLVDSIEWAIRSEKPANPKRKK